MSIVLVCFVRSHSNALCFVLCFPCVDILLKFTASTTLPDSTAAAANGLALSGSPAVMSCDGDGDGDGDGNPVDINVDVDLTAMAD
jgi:hypothetical protein